MTVRSRAFALLLAWVALTVQTKSVQLPPQALNQLAEPPVATVEAAKGDCQSGSGNT
jgi:hypothetical protein